MNKINILNKIFEAKIIAILRKIESEKIEKTVEKLIDGGIDCIEITMDSCDTLTAIKKVRNSFGNSILVGAGTVLDGTACRLAIEAGAQYIISPNIDVDVINTANMYGKPSIPGAMTPTEILKAYKYGASLVKVFPASTLGPSYFKEISGPLGFIPVMATGGINYKNIIDFKNAGVKIFGIGSSLVNRKDVQENNFEKIKDKAIKFKQLFKEREVNS
jgi:2-dehydro-3-deoxyphosphogluconate aldolase/(4S)-4-hydroxy-2-oxoglutarate aldolase